MLEKVKFPLFFVVGMLTLSNIFMTFAWYGHLKHRDRALAITIIVSWAIAFFEYCLQVPANRLGSYHLTAAQLKVMQEAIALVVFGGFSVLYLRERPTLYDLAAYILVGIAVWISVSQPAAARRGHGPPPPQHHSHEGAATAPDP